MGLNATCLNDRPSGAKQRFLGIYGALFQRLPAVEFVVFEPRDCPVASWFSGLPNVSARPTPVPSFGRLRKLAAGVGYWRQAFASASLDIYEAMHLPLVRPARGKAVLTIHDVRGLYPDSPTLHRVMFTIALRSALQRSDHVVTVSAAMREEILAFYPHTPVSVVYNGLDVGEVGSAMAADRKAFLGKYGLPGDFVLAVGHFERRKNYPRLIEAMALLQQRGLDCPLVIIGNDSGEGAALKRLINALGLAGRVTLLTGLSDLEVRCAYQLCSLFVFPSAYEGFGIPILEAMAAERPYVLSDLPVFREITENTAVYFPHDDIEAMANAIERGLASSDLRERLVCYGSQRVQAFGFARLAEQMVGVYGVG